MRWEKNYFMTTNVRKWQRVRGKFSEDKKTKNIRKWEMRKDRNLTGQKKEGGTNVNGMTLTANSCLGESRTAGITWPQGLSGLTNKPIPTCCLNSYVYKYVHVFSHPLMYTGAHKYTINREHPSVPKCRWFPFIPWKILKIHTATDEVIFLWCA